MTFDAGTQVVTTAGTAERLSADLDANSIVRADTVITDIVLHAPAANTGNVFIGREERGGSSDVTSSYGITLAPGESLVLSDVNDKFDKFDVNAAVSGEAVEWAVIFT